ncbi:MAG: hypothetical protein M3044_16065 [Thermoproteota archaeon]|nr:hypothetical protein [Thermoproteota archaeon]
MNHNVTVAIAAIVAAMTLTAVAFAIPQQALGYKPNNHSDKNSLKVNQQTSQANVCTGAAPADGEDDGQGREERLSAEEAASAPTICQNNGTNTADISR